MVPSDEWLFCFPLTWIVSVVGSLVDQDKFCLGYVIHPAELSDVQKLLLFSWINGLLFYFVSLYALLH